ncbi:MAG TPA: hypothetical protein VM554_09290 [Acidisarcina sp.]|nr:hypothetical protein [Acidisarcina sp.]
MTFSRIRKFRFERPQQFAALLLLLLLVQCLWVIRHQTLTDRDYQFARCGREMWERPSPLAGYFTSCGNIHDGTLGYRAAGLPLTVERVFAGQSTETSTWEGRHQLGSVVLLMRLAFVLAGIGLGGALWWVTRRLYGNEGGFVALSLYCFSPDIVRACTSANNEILAAFGLYAAVYTAIGVAHAMQGPQHKWRPRLILLTAAFGFTAAAHVSAALLAFVLAFLFLAYLAEGRRAYIIPILMVTGLGTLLLLFASYAFRPDAFSYVFRSGVARISFSSLPAQLYFSNVLNAGITLAAAAALALYLVLKHARYFGNTTPLLVALPLFFLVTTGVQAQPWIWAIPFLLTFVSGVFADVLESRHRRVFLFATVSVLLAQAALCVAGLPLLWR